MPRENKGDDTMLYEAKNDILSIGNTAMEYIRFGSGKQTLIMLPGLGDGLRTMRGTALPMAAMYRCFTKDYTVYAFSRRNTIPEGFTTRDMAEDVCFAMEINSCNNPDFTISWVFVYTLNQFYSIEHFPTKIKCPK